MNRRISFAIGTLAALTLLVGASVSAQTDLGLQDAAGNIGLAQGNLTLMIARGIRAFFGLLGITAVCLIGYGGFVWMTAGGSDEKVDQAKKIMINGSIGLMVILSSFAIASFVINAIVNGTTGGIGGNGAGDGSGTGGAGGGLPGGSSSVMVVRMPSSTKAGFVPEFNLYFYKGFGEAATPKLSTVIFNQTIFLTKNNVEEPVDLETDGNMVRLKAKTVCPKNSKNTPFCFENNAEYVLTVKDGIAGITTEDGLPLQCDAANPCTVIVKTGNIDDATKPSADISYLHQKGGAGAQFGNGTVMPLDTDFVGHSQAKDNTEVKHISVFKGDTLYGYYQAKQGVDGYYPLETEITFPWTTNGLKLFQNDVINITATDTSNNESEKRPFNYSTQGAQCSDGIQNTSTSKPAGDETGVDCGGTSCLSCNGGSCSNDTQCASGICDKKTNQCSEDPVIYGVFNNDGAAGSVVSIIGKGFGAEKGTGSVSFGVGATEKVATIASCGNLISWSNNEIIAIVPQGATTGGVKVTRKDGKADTTSDTAGPKLPAFTVNEVVRPGILCVTPKEGFFGTSLTITGSGFGATQDANSRVVMGDVFISPKQWSETKIVSTIPSIPAGLHSVMVSRGDNKSNPASVKVKEGSGTTQPTVSAISPSKTTPGSVVVISGNGFGDARGAVYFGDKLGDFNLPAECSTNAWTNNRIVVRVPVGVVGNVEVAIERVNPVVKTKGVSLIVENGAPNPSICNISPDNGPAGSKVKISGENFGTEKGTVALDGTNLSVGEWGQSNLGNVGIDTNAKTGYVTVATNQSLVSNGFPFVVQDCKVAGCANGGTCCDAGSAKGSCVPQGSQCPGSAGAVAANYSWLFSTGDIPVIPSLVFQCGNAIVPSPAPWSGRNGGNEACINAKITGVFTTAVREFSLGKDLVVEKCDDDACEKTSIVEGVLDTNTAQGFGFEVAPKQKLQPNTRYRVTLSTNITGIKLSGSGKPLTMAKDETCKKPTSLSGDASACFTFKTKNSTEACEVTSVLVDPTQVAADSLGLVMQPQEKTRPLIINASGRGDDACVLFNTNGGAWSYSVVNDPNPASVNLGPVANKPQSRTVTTLKEHPANSKGYIFKANYTNPSGKNVNTDGSVKVSLARPQVVSYSPNCNAACINGDVEVGFNVAMNSATLKGNIIVEACTEESCTQTGDIITIAGVSETIAQNGTRYILDLSDEFKAGQWYKVTVKGGENGIKSASGGSLSNTNANTDFTWKFRTRNSGDECVVKSVDVVPVEGRVKSIGSSVTYRAIPRTAPDSCDAKGQTLQASSYAWNWSVADNNVAKVSNDDAGEMPQYCTSSCTLAGSNFYKAICGDGVVTAPFEMCDGGPGCTSNCLLKGNSTASCGNGKVETELGESCDDKNNKNGDGCSSQCLHEGAVSSVVCGNGDIGLGEMCDDGNTANGDGCSSQCLSEGSVRFDPKCADITANSPEALQSQCAGVIFASCGNGVLEAGETCDEGLRCENGATCKKDSECGKGSCKPRTTNTCTDRCLNPKFIPSMTSASCGNGIIDVEQGEQCDPSNDGDSRIDPTQKVTALGQSTVVNGEQKTLVSAQITADKANKAQNAKGDGSFVLQCGFLSDADCSTGINGEEMGLANNSCCGIRPKMVKNYPENNSTNICTNTAVWTETSAPLDHASLVGNVGLFVKVSDGTTNCPGDMGAPVILGVGNEKGAWWKNVIDRVMQYVVGKPVYADITACPSPVKGTIKAITDAQKTRILFSPSALLNKNTEYYFAVKGGTSGAKSAQGIAFSDGYKTFKFQTGSELCTLQNLELDTDEYLFTKQNENHQFVSRALSKDGAELTPVPGVYAWNYEWVSTNEEPSGVYLYGENNEKTNKPSSVISSQNVFATSVQGRSQLSVLATITDDGGTNTKDKTLTATTELTSAFCENPWPKLNNNKGLFNDRFNAKYSSQFGNGFSLNGGAKNTIYTNFEFNYCKDQGVSSLVSDDLPSLQPVVIGNPPDAATTLKEFFFSPVNEQGARINKDVIGIRVEKNYDHLPIEKWYAARGFAGNPTPVVVDGFSALQDGRTVYISGINASVVGRTVTELRTNVYVISYNQGADATTVAIFNQIVKNFKLAVNVRSTNLCYVEKSVSGIGLGQMEDEQLVKPSTACIDDTQCGTNRRCDAVKTKAARDVQRLSDTKTMQNLLDTYFEQRGTYPVIGAGSFLPGKSVSTWKSWQGALGNELKTSLPIDPINKLAACSDKDAESGTCWNAKTGTYACPAGSFMYAYETKNNAQDYVIKSQFELSTALWKNNEINNVRLITDGACTNTAVGASSVAQCGNNILEGDEECDPKGSQVKEVVGNKTYTYICQADCKKGKVVSQAGASCGNGVLDAGELCDDGKYNGSYGYCNATCTTRLACGDGVIQNATSNPKGPEVCELKRCDGNRAISCSTDADCTKNIPLNEFVGDFSKCTSTDLKANGLILSRVYNCGVCSTKSVTTYAPKKEQSCNWDCRSFGPYCGDGVVNGGEECDAGPNGGEVKIDCTMNNGNPGQKTGSCSNTCSWTVNAKGASCSALPATVGGGSPVVADGCGDGQIDKGEECDLGSNNGVKCSAPYKGTCPYCSAPNPATGETGCKNKIITGARCGDGILNGPEKCDGKDFGTSNSATMCQQFGYDAGTPSCSAQCNGITETGCIKCSYTNKGTSLGHVVVKVKDGLSSTGTGALSARAGVYYKNGLFPDVGGKALGSTINFDMTAVTNVDGTPACTPYRVYVAMDQNASNYTTETTASFPGDNVFRRFDTFLFEKSKLPGNSYAIVTSWDDKITDIDVTLHVVDGGKPIMTLSKIQSSNCAGVKCLKYNQTTAATLDRTDATVGGYETLRLYPTKNGLYQMNAAPAYIVKVRDNTGKKFANYTGKVRVALYNANGLVKDVTVGSAAEYSAYKNSLQEKTLPSDENTMYFLLSPNADAKSLLPLF